MRPGVAAVLVLSILPLAGCSLRKAGLARMADAISATSSTFATDNDPEFVRLAAPSTLKMVEMLLQEQPRHHGLLSTACSGFTQYAYAFLQVDAEGLGPDRASEARELRRRASQMYGRARDYCLRALDTRIDGVAAALPAGKIELLQRTEARDVPVLFWLGASWGGSLSVAETPVLRIGEIPALRAVLKRALQLDPDWESGAIHEALIAL